MKKLLSSVGVIALALSAGSALAADLPSRKDAPVYVPPAPMIGWGGLYGGANIGAGWDSRGANNWNGNGNTVGVLGGPQVGYNFALSRMFILGVETDFQATSMTFNASGANLDWFGTVRGRAGIAIVPSLLIYGTGGFAYGQVTNNLIEDVTIKTGWTAGGGVEWMFLPNWSVKAEYLYSDISGSNNGYIGNGFVGNNGFVGGNWHNHERWNTVRAGLNYHFNWGDPAPVVAKYLIGPSLLGIGDWTQSSGRKSWRIIKQSTKPGRKVGLFVVMTQEGVARSRAGEKLAGCIRDLQV